MHHVQHGCIPLSATWRLLRHVQHQLRRWRVRRKRRVLGLRGWLHALPRRRPVRGVLSRLCAARWSMRRTVGQCEEDGGQCYQSALRTRRYHQEHGAGRCAGHWLPGRVNRHADTEDTKGKGRADKRDWFGRFRAPAHCDCRQRTACACTAKPAWPADGSAASSQYLAIAAARRSLPPTAWFTSTTAAVPSTVTRHTPHGRAAAHVQRRSHRKWR